MNSQNIDNVIVINLIAGLRNVRFLTEIRNSKDKGIFRKSIFLIELTRNVDYFSTRSPSTSMHFVHFLINELLNFIDSILQNFHFVHGPFRTASIISSSDHFLNDLSTHISYIFRLDLNKSHHTVAPSYE